MGSKIGRNDPCPCGSGKKYKKCHLGEYDNGVLLAAAIPDYPVTFCAVNDDYEELGLATVIIVREVSEVERFVLAVYLCDVFCLGVKDLIYETNAQWSRVENVLISKAMTQSFVDIDYAKARNLILGSVEYARSLGFEPCPDYQRAKPMIEADKPLTKHKFRFGRDGVPFYITGPNDNYHKIFKTLEASVGKGNFDYEIDERSGFHYAG